MRNFLRSFGTKTVNRAMDANIGAIKKLLDGSSGGKFLDVGCDDGVRTLEFARASGATEVHGVEIIADAAEAATARGIIVKSFDLCEPWPYEESFFDFVCSNQVIEHLRDTDIFLKETMRCLRPGGLTVVSTENLASWHNIAALVLGWQPFSLTNVSSEAAGIGNPLALHSGEDPQGGASWQHMRIFAYSGLQDLYLKHGFVSTEIIGSGYYPLPRRVAGVDPRHAAFLALSARKPSAP